MNPNKLKRLRRQLAKLRRQSKGGIASEKIESFAKALGRVQRNPGKHVNWESELLPHSRPISIPHHGKPLKPFTAGEILDSLELDLEIFEEMNENDEKNNRKGRKKSDQSNQ